MAYEIPPESLFVDREPEQAAVLEAVGVWGEQTRPLCVALRGLAGVGKTELAFRLARRLRVDCPDGALYVDLGEFRLDGAVETADVLGELLRSLGVPAGELGLTLRARRKQFLTRTEGKELVLVVDNVRYAAELEPLLPASGGSVVVAVSHGPLYDLPEGTVELPLGPLSDAHASELLRRLARDERLVGEGAPEPVLRLCSGLPAALRVVGGLLRRHPRRSLERLLAGFGAELEERGLPVVEQVWDAAYRELGPEAARLYRLLAVVPGPSFTASAAAALLGSGPEEAQDALEELEAAGLLDGRLERLRVPELLRAHARRRAREDGDVAEAEEGRARAVRWYLRQAQRADKALAGARMVLALPAAEVPGAPDVSFGVPPEDKAAAADWLEAERHALYAGVQSAYAAGLDAEAWALCEPLWTHFLDHPHHTEAIEAFRTGAAAAQRAGNVRALIRMRCQLARPLWERERYAEATAELAPAMQALELLDESGDDRRLRASAIEFRGMLASRGGDWRAAAEEFTAARQIHEAIDNEYGATLMSYRLGEAAAALGELHRARDLLAAAHAFFTADQRERLAGRAALALACVLDRLTNADEALPLYEAALAAARRRRAVREELRVLEVLSDSDAVGSDDAGRYAVEAAALRGRLGLA